jgi:hypothetical protein
MVRDPCLFARSKHIAIKYFFCREQHDIGEIVADYISTKENLADLLTKEMSSADRHWELMSKLMARPTIGKRKLASGSSESQREKRVRLQE